MSAPVYVIDPYISFIEVGRPNSRWLYRAHGPHLEEGVGNTYEEAVVDFHRRKVVAIMRKHLGTDTRPACETDRLLRRRAKR